MKTTEDQPGERLDFEALYRRYPRKEGKAAGMKKLRLTIKTRAEYDALSSAIDQYVNVCEVEGRQRKYIKHWGTFCNNWTDYLVEIAPADPFDQLKRVMEGKL